MIIGTYGPREVGDIYNGLTAQSGDTVNYPIPYKVLREATEADWIEEQKSDGFWGPMEQFRFMVNPQASHYYEVSVD